MVCYCIHHRKDSNTHTHAHALYALHSSIIIYTLLQTPVPVPMEEEVLLESSSNCSHYYEVSWETHIKEMPVLLGQLYYDPASESLTMINKNTCLHRRCLLLGYTSKKEEGKDRNSSIIGQFGMRLCVVCMYV